MVSWVEVEGEEFFWVLNEGCGRSKTHKMNRLFVSLQYMKRKYLLSYELNFLLNVKRL